jgi:hypothetical protein
MNTTTAYDSFTAFAQTFREANPQMPVAGDDYDQPGAVVYHQATRQLPGGGRIEVNTLTPEAPAAFAWEVEVTINDKQGGRFVHLILQRDHEVVETYGKTIIPVDPRRAAEIHDVLAELGAG